MRSAFEITVGAGVVGSFAIFDFIISNCAEVIGVFIGFEATGADEAVAGVCVPFAFDIPHCERFTGVVVVGAVGMVVYQILVITAVVELMAVAAFLVLVPADELIDPKVSPK